MIYFRPELEIGGRVRPAIVVALAASVLTGITASPRHAEAATPCAVARSTSAVSRWLPGAVSRPGSVSFFRFRTSSARWTLIKLGNLRSDLELKLYDASCGLIATSQHGGVHFEQLYRRLPAGRYYLGVAGVAGATSPFAVRFAPLRDGVRVLSTHAFMTGYRSDVLEVDGEVLNNLSAPNFFRGANLTFYDRWDHVVARAEGSFLESYVRARSRAPFTAQLIEPKRPYTRYTVTMDTEALNGYPAPPRARIVADAPELDDQGNLYFPGRITNVSTRTIWLGSVQATLYNRLGNVDYVNSGVISPDQLKPKRTGHFVVVFIRPTGVNCAAFSLAA